MKMGTPRLFLVLCGFGAAYGNAALAADWQIAPRLDLVETYSDNITLASDAAVASDDYITQIAPAITIKGEGNRLKLDSSYTLQNIFYANNSSRNKSHNQLQLGADAELIEELFYLSVDGRFGQQLLTTGRGLAADNLNIDSGRGDVVTTRIEPSIKRRLGKYVEFDLSYSEGRVNYDSLTIADASLQKKKFSMRRSREPAKLDWRLNYSQSRQWAAERLTSEREQSAAALSYDLFEHVSLVANGGNEDSQLNSSNKYKSGTYWSAGLKWRPSPHLSLEAASGDNDRQVRLLWAPSARTSLSATYLDREVGVRARNSRAGSFKHSTRRTLWTLGYVEEITSDAILAIVGVEDIEGTGEPIFDESGLVVVKQRPVFGIVDEQFLRESSQGSVTYSVRRNDLSLRVNSEQRRYELSGRQAQLHGGSVGWRLRLSARANSNVRYTVNRITENTIAKETETKSLVWSLQRTLGKRTTTGLELRTTEVDGGAASSSRSENRLSANARMVF